MKPDPTIQPSARAMPEPTNWKFSLVYPAAMVTVGSYMLVIVAVTTSASSDPKVWLHVLAEWGASSSGHIPWSAPLLVTSVGALAALSNSSLARDEFLGLALTLSAQAIAVGAALWMLTALMAATVPGIVSDASERSQLWGVVFVAGPVIICAAIFAGRFKRVTPEVRIAFAQRVIPVLDRELGETVRFELSCKGGGSYVHDYGKADHSRHNEVLTRL